MVEWAQLSSRIPSAAAVVVSRCHARAPGSDSSCLPADTEHCLGADVVMMEVVAVLVLHATAPRGRR